MGLTVNQFVCRLHISELWTLSLDLDGRSKASKSYESKPGALLNVGMLMSKMMSKMLISWFLTDPQIMLINLTKRGLAMSDVPFTSAVGVETHQNMHNRAHPRPLTWTPNH